MHCLLYNCTGKDFFFQWSVLSICQQLDFSFTVSLNGPSFLPLHRASFKGQNNMSGIARMNGESDSENTQLWPIDRRSSIHKQLLVSCLTEFTVLKSFLKTHFHIRWHLQSSLAEFYHLIWPSKRHLSGKCRLVI